MKPKTIIDIETLTRSREQVLHAMRESGLSENQGMNLLQDHGIISDNCVMLDSVAIEDHERAIEFLKNRVL